MEPAILGFTFDDKATGDVETGAAGRTISVVLVARVPAAGVAEALAAGRLTQVAMANPAPTSAMRPLTFILDPFPSATSSEATGRN